MQTAIIMINLQSTIQTQSHHADVDHLSVQHRMLVSQKSAKFLAEIEKDLFSDGIKSLERSFLFALKQKMHVKLL